MGSWLHGAVHIEHSPRAKIVSPPVTAIQRPQVSVDATTRVVPTQSLISRYPRRTKSGNVFCNRPSGTFENAILTGDVIYCYMAFITFSPPILHSTTATQVSVLKKDRLITSFYFLLKLIHHLFRIERALYTAQPNPIRSPRHMQKLLVHHRPDRLGKLEG